MPFLKTKSSGVARLSLVVIGLVLLAIVAFVVLFTRGEAFPSAMPISQCIERPAMVAPIGGWRFKRDVADVGLNQRWFETAFNDLEWEADAPGKEWTPEYTGVAWYRASFGIPASWETAYIGVAGVDDDAQLWINGVLADWKPKDGASSTIVQLPVGQTVQLTLRIVNIGGPGGIKQPVVVSQSPRGALSEASYASWLAVQQKNWPMPGWTKNDYYAWTFMGLPGKETKALIGSDGAVAPWAAAPSVNLWLYDAANGGLLSPKPEFSLSDDSLPIPQTQWQTAGLKVQTTLFRPPDGDIIRWQASVTNQTNETRDVKLLLVVRPIAIGAGLRPVYAAGFDGQGRLWLDGKPFMATSPIADQYGVAEMVDVLDAVVKGKVHNNKNLACAPGGDAASASAFVLSIRPGETYKLVADFPSEPSEVFPAVGTGGDLDQARHYWQTTLGESDMVIPDQSITNAYRASSGYLLLALSPTGPRPGPLAHNKLWVRDAAFIGDALISLGQSARVKDYVPLLFAHQAADGRIPPIIASDGPEAVDEWDSQGQAIHVVASLYRTERDRALLQQWEPQVKLAAEFLRSLRARTQNDPLSTRGLLPPSASAEDLGSSEWHHYWDDFWAFAGLEEAAFIESELGNNDDANWMRNEANALRQSIRSSIEIVMGANPAYIPNGSEDLTSSSMARGTSMSLYPVEVLSRNDPLVTRSFQAYYEKWIAPSNGGYTHIWGQWWPYGGLGLARDYLRLGRQDIVHQILAWTLNHQTLPGTYSWAEQVSPEHGGITGGDMPHAWAAANFVSLIREMMVMTDGDRLQLFAGVPPSWFDAGKTVGVRNTITDFGSLTAFIEGNIDTDNENAAWQGVLTVKIDGNAHPTGGFYWQLPRLPTWVDGPSGTEVRDGGLVVPSSGGIVRLGYNVPRDGAAQSR